MTDLNPRFSHESFVVGPTNQVAATAALKVAESPGAAYNPLCIYGASGLGKTHLLNAIGLRTKALAPGASVEYLTLEEFSEALHAAVAAGQAAAFHGRFSHVDVLLLDDVQFLADRRDAQAELLKLSGDLRAAGHQLVLSSDRPVGDIDGIDQRLAGAMSGGLVVDVARPDYETRLGILGRRAQERGVEFASGVLEAAAKFDVPNVRELIGALNRLVALQAVSDAPVTPGGVESLLSDLVSVHGAGGPAAAPAGIGGGDFIVGDAALSEVGLPPVAAPDPVRGPAAPPPAPPPPPPPPPPPAPPRKSVAGPAKAPGARPAGPVPSKPGDEFAQFLSGVESSVARTVEAWRARLGEAILRWEGEGYQTARLGSVLDQGDAKGAEAAVRQFEHDVERLRSYENEMAVLDPGAAGQVVFRDPDRVGEAEALVRRAREGVALPPGPSAVWAFDGLRVGESNRMAYTAALAVVETPGTRHNPLVLVGPPGVGKTHLLHSVGHALAAGPGALVACLSAQDYVDELAQASEANRADQWRSRYRRATAFLLDDMQLISGSDAAQAELLQLFSHMLAAERQMMFSLNAPPRDVGGLDDRLVARLEGGLVATVDRPDPDLRRALIEKQMTERLEKVDPGLVDYFVGRPAESVRVVQSMVQRVLRTAESEGMTPDAAFARALLEGQPVRPSPRAAGVRTSGMAVAPSTVVRSREKLVWEWPDPADRLIEDLD